MLPMPRYASLLAKETELERNRSKATRRISAVSYQVSRSFSTWCMSRLLLVVGWNGPYGINYWRHFKSECVFYLSGGLIFINFVLPSVVRLSQALFPLICRNLSTSYTHTHVPWVTFLHYITQCFPCLCSETFFLYYNWFYCKFLTFFTGVCKECIMTHQQMHRPSQSQPFMQQYRRVNQPSPSPPPVLNKSTILPQPRQIIPSKSVSPRPHHPGSPGYASPPPSGGTIPMTSSCSSSFGSFPINNQYLPVCQSSPPQITIQSTVVDHASQHPTDHIDILSSFCSPADNCSVTPSRSPQQVSSPSFCNTVVHSDQQMMEGIGFSDNHPGPVSPDEFNCYLPNNSHVVAGSFGPSTSCSSHQQQDFANVFSGSTATAATTIGVVQPSSLGQFSQNPWHNVVIVTVGLY